MSTETVNLTTVAMIPLAIFSFLITIFGLIGNTTVIYASIRYGVLKLDKVSLIFIQNLAVADIFYILTTVFPSFLTYSAGEWVLGKGWCFMQAQLRLVPAIANCLLVLAITLYRMVLFTVPSRSLSTKSGTICSVFIWAVAILVPSATLGRRSSQQKFDLEIGACISLLMYDEPMKVVVYTAILIFLPLVLITLSNFSICIIVINRSTRRGEARSGITLTFLLSGLFILSWSPCIVRNIYRLVNYPDLVPQKLELLAYNCIAINSFVNPILYSLTNRSFRKYVVEVVSYFGQLLNWRTPQTQPQEVRMT